MSTSMRAWRRRPDRQPPLKPNRTAAPATTRTPQKALHSQPPKQERFPSSPRWFEVPPAVVWDMHQSVGVQHPHPVCNGGCCLGGGGEGTGWGCAGAVEGADAEAAIVRSCPILTHEKYFSPSAVDKQCTEYVSKSRTRCKPPEVPTGTLTQPLWQPPLLLRASVLTPPSASTGGVQHSRVSLGGGGQIEEGDWM